MKSGNLAAAEERLAKGRDHRYDKLSALYVLLRDLIERHRKSGEHGDPHLRWLADP